MRTLATIRALASDVIWLLHRRWWLMTVWFSLGWSVHQLAMFGSALLGVGHAVLANLLFVLGVVARIASLVLMVSALGPALTYRSNGRRPEGGSLRIPDEVFAEEDPWRTAALSIGPFLAVYAVWGFVQDEVTALFESNYTLLGLGDVTRWSISLAPSRWPFYLGMAVSGWLARLVVERVRRARSTRLLDALGILAEGVWTLGLFIVLIMAANATRDWLQTRTVTVGLLGGWRAFLSWLPDWQLLLGQSLAQLVDQAVTVLPGAAATVLALPLVWLALTATVFGWREVRAEDVLAGTRAERRARQLSAVRSDPIAWLARQATGDLRTKYLPVAQALRLVGAAGPRFVGAYLLLATFVTGLQDAATVGLSIAVGPQSMPASLLLDPLQQFVVALPATLLAVALYGAGFDRAMTIVTGPASARAELPPDGPPPDEATKVGPAKVGTPKVGPDAVRTSDAAGISDADPGSGVSRRR